MLLVPVTAKYCDLIGYRIAVIEVAAPPHALVKADGDVVLARVPMRLDREDLNDPQPIIYQYFLILINQLNRLLKYLNE